MAIRTTEIIYEKPAANRFDPLDPDTLQLEEKLQRNGLSSAKPIGYKGLPSGTVGMRFGKDTVLARSQQDDEIVVVYGAATGGNSLEKLIKKIAGNK